MTRRIGDQLLGISLGALIALATIPTVRADGAFLDSASSDSTSSDGGAEVGDGTEDDANRNGSEQAQAEEKRPFWEAGVVLDRLQVWTSSTQVRGSFLEPGQGVGIGAYSGTRAYVHRGVLSGRYTNFAHIGYGAGGVESGAGGDLAVGLRLPVADTHGPVMRAGLRGHLVGNSLFFVSALELPQVQLGYQWIERCTHLELFLRSALNVTGRYFPDRDAGRRTSGSAVTGLVAVAGSGPWHVELAWDRTRVEDALATSIHRVQGEACVTFPPLSTCIEGRHERGDSMSGNLPIDSRITFVGMSIGYGSLRHHGVSQSED